uniref:Pol-like protein n=1 Tax=Phallusia mammillata TaxID=59560 RepID=A0A6F9DM65_9ASCI|nr:pol-like protein [Phallusia mammillata]
MANFLKMATCNVGGMAGPAKRSAVLSSVRSLDAHIIFFQETHSSPMTEGGWCVEWEPNKAIFWSSLSGARSENGVGILLKHNALSFVSHSGDGNGRILAADIRLYHSIIHVVNVYAPNRTESTPLRNAFFDSLYTYTYSRHPTLLAGDFNGVQDPILERFPPLRGSNEKLSGLIALVENLQLSDSFRKLYGNRIFYTRRQHNTQSRLDRFYISPHVHPISEFGTQNSLSDHDIITLQIRTEPQPPRGKGIWKNNTSTYTTDAFQEELERRWALWRTLQVPCFKDKFSWWLDMKHRIKLMNIAHSQQNRQQANTEAKQLEERVTAIWGQLARDPTLLPEYLSLKRLSANTQRQSARAKILKSQASCFDRGDRGTKEFFQRFTEHRSNTGIVKLCDDSGRHTENTNEMLNIAHTFYSKLYTKRPTCTAAQQHFLQHVTPKLDSNDDTLGKPITAEEVLNTIMQMSLGKSPGPDGVSVEFYRSCWRVIGQDLTDVINTIHSSGTVPDEMKRGTVTLIHKKNDTTLLKNYRPISLLNTDLKIYTKILANRMRALLDKVLHPQQFAAPARRIADATVLLRDLYCDAIERGTDAFTISLDFEKAFDSVDHGWLYSVMTKMCFPEHFVKVVQSLNTNAQSNVLVNGHQSPLFTVGRGVRQGDPLSLFLYLIAATPFSLALTADTSVRGIDVPGRHVIKCPSYADDTTLTLTHPYSVTRAFQHLELLYSASGLALNVSKSKGLFTKPNPPLASLPPLEWTSSHISLLGTVIGNAGSVTESWRAHYRTFRSSMTYHTRYILTWNAKSLISKSKLLPLLTYQASTYPIPNSLRRRVNIARARCL